MQFLAVLRRKTEDFSDAQFAPLLETEAEVARTLHAGGRIRQIWGRTDVPGAAMMVEAESLAEVQVMLDELPLVHAKMLEVQIIGLRAYRGFAPKNS